MASFSYICMNARSLLNKLDELERISCTQPRPNIIGISETWCSPAEPDSLYALDGYTLYRSDRAYGRGGGAALYIHDTLHHSLHATVNGPHLEATWVEVKTTNKTLVIACIYRPPRSDHRQFCTQLEDALRKLQTTTPHVLLLGDFNAKNAQWLDTDVTDASGDSLACLLETHGLVQHVSFPTCIVRDVPKSCLDLVISNIPSDQVSAAPAAPLGSSDHLSVRGTIQVSSVTTPPQDPPAPQWSWTWEASRVSALRSALSATQLLPPDQACAQLSTDELWQTWRGELLRVAHLYCTTFPLKDRSMHSLPLGSTSRRRPWITEELRQAIAMKHRLFRDHLRLQSQLSWNTFRTQRNKVMMMLRQAKSAFVCQANGQSRDQPPYFNHGRLHKLMACLKLKSKDQMPDINDHGRTLTSPTDKATAFNNFFVSESQKSVTPGESDVPTIDAPEVTDSQLQKFSVDTEEVLELLRDLDVHKAAGDDHIPTRLLKETASEISPSLCRLFNISFLRGDLPLDWRSATVSPIHKKGSKGLTTNYRPISLLSIVSKVQERIVHRRLYKHLEPYLPTGQSGYRQNDGTEFQLLRLVHEISAHRDNGHAVMACFFDLSKAFDRVWHAGLLSKLAHFGVKDQALAWLTGYLHQRRQRVRVDGNYSSWLKIPAGVPQGSVLGPLLFLAFTIDRPRACTNRWTKYSQYTDDTALISHHADAATSSSMLQTAVSSAAKWLTTWHLLVNTSKTVVMAFQGTAAAKYNP